MKGWLKIHRSLDDHWLWDFNHPDKAMAWIDLLMLARHSGGQIVLKGRVIDIKRGQIALSQLALQKRWGWSQNKVKRFLNRLQSDSMCDFKTNDLTTIITICNYSIFQDGELKADDPTNDHTDDHTDDQTDEDIRMKEGKKERKGGNPTGLLVAKEIADSGEDKIPRCPHQDIIDLYHKHCPMFPPIRKWTDNRQKKLRSRWRENPEHQTLKFWEDLFKHASQSVFLRGENNRGWVCDLDFIITASKFASLIEGKYHHQEKQQSQDDGVFI